MSTTIVFGIPIDDAKTAGRTKTVMRLGMAMMALVVIQAIISLVQTGMTPGTPENVLKCAGDKDVLLDLPDYRWNVTKTGNQEQADKALKCYQDQLGGVTGWITPFVGIIISIMVPLFAYLGAKKKNRSLICASCVMAFVCGVLAIAGIVFIIIGVLVVTKSIALPERAGGRTGPCASYPITLDYRICMGNESGSAGTFIPSTIVSVVLLVMWWVLAICTCFLYNDPYYQTVTVVQSSAPAVATVSVSAIVAAPVQATVVQASVVADGAPASSGGVIKATVVG